MSLNVKAILKEYDSSVEVTQIGQFTLRLTAVLKKYPK
jgi:hypothetical protein